MKRRTRGCPNCGSIRAIDAIDNHGEPYQGCPNCRVVDIPINDDRVFFAWADSVLRAPRAKDPR